VANTRAELRGQIHQLHGSLLMAQSRRKLAGWCGVQMLIPCLTGLYMWRPRNNAAPADRPQRPQGRQPSPNDP